MSALNRSKRLMMEPRSTFSQRLRAGWSEDDKEASPVIPSLLSGQALSAAKDLAVLQPQKPGAEALPSETVWVTTPHA